MANDLQLYAAQRKFMEGDFSGHAHVEQSQLERANGTAQRIGSGSTKRSAYGGGNNSSRSSRAVHFASSTSMHGGKAKETSRAMFHQPLQTPLISPPLATPFLLQPLHNHIHFLFAARSQTHH
jgi:hypothetical protein